MTNEPLLNALDTPTLFNELLVLNKIGLPFGGPFCMKNESAKIYIVIKINGEEYDEVPGEAVSATKALVDIYELLGKPENPLSETGQKLMTIMISIWQDLAPLDYQTWFQRRTEHLNAEMSISEQVAQKTGRSIVVYPGLVYEMMKKIFPKFDACQRDNAMKMAQLYPIFRYVNKI